jgi:CheY-like chemotaxis protein
VKQARLFERLSSVMANHVSRRTSRIITVPPAGLPTVEPPRKGARVLLAEDNRINQMVALGLLQNLGYLATLANNGREVLDMLQREHYDIILMDCQMPEMDGYETTRRIRTLTNQAQPRIIAMTANAMRGESEKCLEAGMDDYMSKPVRLDTLREMLVRWTPASAA